MIDKKLIEKLSKAGVDPAVKRITFNMLTAFYNAVETVGRNRELEGCPPVKCVLLSNSDLIYSDVIAGLGIGETLYQMQETGTEIVEYSKDQKTTQEYMEKRDELHRTEIESLRQSLDNNTRVIIKLEARLEGEVND